MTTTLIIILIVTILLFAWGKFTPDIVALLSMITLFLVGILDVTETLSGFSNPTVIMIACLFIVGEGLSQTGWTALAGNKLLKWAGKSSSKLLVIITLGSGVLSGFVSNTGTVATLLPATISSAWSVGTFPSKVLMPVAFGSNTGGLLTLTGTPPNIIANNALIDAGFNGFSFFEFALIGLPLLIIAILYFKYIGHRLLPSNPTNNKPIDIHTTLHNWIDAYRVNNDVYRLRIRQNSPLINSHLGEWHLERDYNVNLFRIIRTKSNRLKRIKKVVEFPSVRTKLYHGDIITLKGKTEDINKLMIQFRLGLLPKEAVADEMRYNLINQEVGMSEALVTPKSRLVGHTIKLGTYFSRYNIQLLAASRNNKPYIEEEITVQAGDGFIIRGPWKNIEALQKRHENIVLVGSPEGMSKNVDRLTYKSYIALGSLLLMIFLLIFKIVPGAIAALIAAGINLLFGSVPITKAYKGISWISVVMIAAMIPMGTALQKTGLAQDIANAIVNTLGSGNPIYLLISIFLLTSLFSQFINNSATTVLMTPIVILASQSLNINPEPLIITVAISASTAFLTPVGTTTNAMILTAGDYKFTDYFKVGFPLLLLFLITTALLVPIFWHF